LPLLFPTFIARTADVRQLRRRRFELNSYQIRNVPGAKG
jgi:hypothetical protein